MKGLACVTASLRDSSLYASTALLMPGGTLAAVILCALSLRTWISPRRLRAIGMGFVAAARFALAEPVPQTPVDCTSASPEQARSRGDELLERGAYQEAGACYQLAGELERANHAFLKAVGPRREDTARQLDANLKQAKAQFREIGRTFKADH